MKASDARTMSNIFHKKNLNYQRKYVIRLIENEVINHGGSSIALDEDAHRIKMYEEDWEYFEDLGYEVIRPKTEIYPNNRLMISFGIIKW